MSRTVQHPALAYRFHSVSIETYQPFSIYDPRFALIAAQLGFVHATSYNVKGSAGESEDTT
jgi:hypothetical protein